MGKILDYIAKETHGRCFTSYKYCFDTVDTPHLLYEERSSNYTPLLEYAENDHSAQPRDLSSLAEKLMPNAPLFHYFLDGSRKVYKVDDIQYDNKVYPVVSGQISVACCERYTNHNNQYTGFKHIAEEVYSVLSLPVRANMDGNGSDDEIFFRNLCNKINANSELVRKANLRKILHYSTRIQADETFENKAIATIQDDMVECEKGIVAYLTSKNLLTEDRYLIKDGSIQYKTMKTGDHKELATIRNNYRHVVGVSKMFNPDLMKDKKGNSNAGAIANLPLYHRTPAIKWNPGDEWGGVNFAIWYVRIRPQKYTATPYSGILKIEKMLMTGKEEEIGLSSDDIDTISANIINERNPVCYGNDPRWANHLYPVYLTESYCKSRFISDPCFINMF